MVTNKVCNKHQTKCMKSCV